MKILALPEKYFQRLQLSPMAGILILSITLQSSLSLYAQTGLTRAKHELLMAQYRDNANQEVSTVEGKTRINLNPNWSLGLKGLGEWIRITAQHDEASHSQEHNHTNHADHGDHDPGGASMDVDIVTGASIQGHAHHGSGEGRGEGTLSLRHDFASPEPASLSASLRYSGESDFHSSMVTVSGGREFNQRNTALSSYLGAGIDYSSPKETPPGQEEDWPAISRRLAVGVQLGQILSPRFHAGISYAFSLLTGTLENPYRRARIRTSLFPERLPDLRLRHVGGAELSAYLGMGMAAFHREGAYIDSWGIAAWIPESALQMEMGERWMLLFKHKYYYQVPANFYRTSYPNLEGWYTGDIRLGHLEGNSYSLGIDFQRVPGLEGSIFSLMISKSNLTYLNGGSQGENYIVSLGWRSN